jgi:peptide/nickel transport system permease protein
VATVDSTVRAGAPAARGADAAAGLSPYRLGLRRLRRNKAALAFGGLFLLIVVLCLCAPLYADHVAHTSPNANHVTETVTVGGVRHDVVSPTGQPIGPTWQGRFLLGADQNGRDIAVRLLYGGRNSLEVGFLATALTMVLATIVGIVAGFFRGFVDGVLARVLDLIWAYPVVLLGIVWSEILPNVSSTLVVFVPLMIANAILLEAALSYLGAGVQPPNPSWGTMISDGIRLIPSAMHLTFVPGVMLVLAVLGVNVFGDGVRDALDPRAKVRLEEHAEEASR